MSQTTIKNRKNLDLAVFYTEAPHPAKGVIFVEHGFTGHHQETQIKTIAAAFENAGYTTVLFDAANGTGASGDDSEGPTLAGHYNDFEDIITWAAKQSWYQEPFIVSGHSLGASSALIYAANHPQKVRFLLPVSPLLNGEDMYEAMKKQMGENFAQWENGGCYERQSSTTGKIIRVPFTYLSSLHDYSAEQYAGKIKCPTSIVIGNKDEITSQNRAKQFYQKLDCPKNLHILDNCQHIFHTKESIDTLQKCLLEIINNI